MSKEESNVFGKSLRTRMNRFESIAKKNGDNNVLKVVKMLSKFNSEEKKAAFDIFGPLVGYSSQIFSRAMLIRFASIANEDKMIRALRVFITYAVNIFKLSRKTKEIFINSMTLGFNKEMKQAHAIALVIEKVHKDKKAKKPEHKTVDFDGILKIIQNSSEGEGDLSLLALNEGLNSKSRDYFKNTIMYANNVTANIQNLLNFELNMKKSPVSTVIARNGFLSQYRDAKGLPAEGKTYDEAMAMMCVDLAIFVKADLDEMKKYLEMRALIEKQKQMKNSEAEFGEIED